MERKTEINVFFCQYSVLTHTFTSCLFMVLSCDCTEHSTDWHETSLYDI
jgi:hypothetical protein